MNVIHLNKQNFDKEVAKSSIPVVIDFWASWCGPCRMMAPVFESLSADYKGKVKFAKLSTEDEPELAEQFGIRGIPTLVVADKGKELDRLVGFRQKEELKQGINQILGI